MEIRKQKGKQVGRLTVTDKQHQEDLQRLRLLRPIDDEFMRCLFKDNIPLAEFVLRIITNKPDLIITEWNLKSCRTHIQSLSLKKIFMVRVKLFIQLRESTLQRVNLLKMGSIFFM